MFYNLTYSLFYHYGFLLFYFFDGYNERRRLNQLIKRGIETVNIDMLDEMYRSEHVARPRR